MTLTAESAAARHRSLVGEIGEHKRAAAYHRRQVRIRKEALRVLEQQCRSLGIRLVVIAPKEAQTDGRTDPLP